MPKHLSSRMMCSPLSLSVAIILVLLLSTAHAVCNTNADCLNGGTCQDGLGKVNSYCVCASGYMGTNCRDNCPLMCQNGGQCDLDSDEHAFVDGATNFVCDCPSEYQGTLCEELSGMNSASVGSGAPSDSSLSAGAIVGIVVGCLVVMVVALVVSTSGRLRINEKKEVEKMACTDSNGMKLAQITDTDDSNSSQEKSII